MVYQLTGGPLGEERIVEMSESEIEDVKLIGVGIVVGCVMGLFLRGMMLDDACPEREARKLYDNVRVMTYYNVDHENPPREIDCEKIFSVRDYEVPKGIATEYILAWNNKDKNTKYDDLVKKENNIDKTNR